MSTAPVIMMIVAILVVWGGLVVAIVNLNRSPSAVPDVDEVALERDELGQPVGQVRRLMLRNTQRPTSGAATSCSSALRSLSGMAMGRRVSRSTKTWLK